MDVGGLRRGTMSVDVKKPQFCEAFPEAVIREGAGEFTLRAVEVGTQRAFINTEHIQLERWGPPLVDADGHAFCQTIHKGSAGDDWEELCCHYRELSQAVGAEKLSESQQSESLLGYEGSLGGARNFMIQLPEKTFWAAQRRVWNCGKNTSKTQLQHGKKRENPC